jgi:uncharacterized protein (TIGR02996 family)
MRTFRYVDAESQEFWDIEVSGDRCTVTHGELGTEGQTQTIPFLSPEMAQATAEQLIAEKLARGYWETVPSRPPGSLREVLEAAILEDPEDRAAHAALADYLHEQGNPQGEFMQLQLALEDPSLSGTEREKLQARERELLCRHEKEWAGEWTQGLQELEWVVGEYEEPMTGGQPARFIRGILAEARMGYVNVSRARAFLRDPNTRLVRRLFLEAFANENKYEPGPDIPVNPGGRPRAHVLLRWPGLANVRVFQFGEPVDEQYADWCNFHCWTRGEDALAFVKQMPRVEELYLLAYWVNMVKLAALSLPNLRILQVYHNHEYALDKLAENASLGNLTHLLCHPHALEHGDEPYIRLEGLKAVVNSAHLKSLTHLRLRLADFGDKGAEEIVKSGILRRLKVLDLRHGCITDAGARALAECPDLENLELLDLSRNELTSRGIRELKATGVHLLADYQHASTQEIDPDDPGGLEYLYQGDME